MIKFRRKLQSILIFIFCQFAVLIQSQIDVSIQLFEGDIAHNKSRELLIDKKRTDKIFRYASKPRMDYLSYISLWPGARVPYEVVSEDFPRIYQLIIRNAIEDFERHTCVDFVLRRAEDRDYIKIISDQGCYSYLGRIGGPQVLSLNPGCMNHGVVLHELMHALGFAHEHNRADRDQHIRINYDNVLGDKKVFFERYDTADPLGLQMAYDYASLMHYGRTAFSRNGGTTIETKIPNAIIGQRIGFSVMDVKKVKKLYDCTETTLSIDEHTGASNQSSSSGISDSPNAANQAGVIQLERQLQQLQQLLNLQVSPSTRPQPSTTPKPCVDSRSDCRFLNDSGYCDTLQEFMKQFCPQTCRLCDKIINTVTRPTPTSPPLTAPPLILTSPPGPPPANSPTAAPTLSPPPFSPIRNRQFIITDAPGTQVRFVNGVPIPGTAVRQAPISNNVCFEQRPLVCTTMAARGFCDQIWFRVECPSTCGEPACRNLAPVAPAGPSIVVQPQPPDIPSGTGGSVGVPQPPGTATVTGVSGSLLNIVGSTGCADRRTDCAQLLLQAQCRTNRSQMILDCASTCGFCNLQGTLTSILRLLQPPPASLVGSSLLPLPQAPSAPAAPIVTQLQPQPQSQVQLQQPAIGLCVDARADCPQIAAARMCNLYPTWMQRYCPVSCNVCLVFQGGQLDGCVDRRPDCDTLVRSFQCGIYPVWMQEWCPRGCRFCTSTIG